MNQCILEKALKTYRTNHGQAVKCIINQGETKQLLISAIVKESKDSNSSDIWDIVDIWNKIRFTDWKNPSPSQISDLYQFIIIKGLQHKYDIRFNLVKPKGEAFSEPAQIINSEDDIIKLFNAKNYFDFCKIIENNITNNDGAEQSAQDLYSLLNKYAEIKSEEEKYWLVIPTAAIPELKDDPEFKGLCSELNYAKKDLKAEIEKLIAIYNQPWPPTQKIIEQYQCEEKIADDIRNHLSNYYSQPESENNWIVSNDKVESLAKDYKFISLLEKCTGKKLTKEITSVDDIFNLFNNFEFSKKNQDLKSKILIKNTANDFDFQCNFKDVQNKAFFNKIASLSDNQDKDSKAEQLYYVLNYFATRDGGTISDETKEMLKSCTEFQQLLLFVCSLLSEKSAEHIQNWAISKKIGFQPRNYQEQLKFQQLEKDLNKLIINDKAISM